MLLRFLSVMRFFRKCLKTFYEGNVWRSSGVTVSLKPASLNINDKPSATAAFVFASHPLPFSPRWIVATSTPHLLANSDCVI